MRPSNLAETALSLIESDKSKVLGLTVGKHANVQPGQYIAKAEAQSEPELSFATLSPEKTYLIVGLDLDGPFPSFSFLSPALHWIQPGLKPEPAGVGGFSLKYTDPYIVDWVGPGPPPGSSPHRYTFFLYEEPESFDAKKYTPPVGKKVGLTPRVRYDLDLWAKEIKLGPAVAVNYFNCN
ncbi:putative protease inhibitor [Hypoxylon sp. NC1633]|nr:putative protease inhibitor [Hypoxylon sp. NC1633]